MSGKLRLARTGGIVAGFYWDSTANEWVEMGSAFVSHDDLYYHFSVGSGDPVFNHETVRVAFDNFQASSGAFGSVTGVVSTTSGPLPNAVVELRKKTVPIIACVTDNNGVYLASDIPAGPVDVAVIVPLGYEPVTPPGGAALVDVACETATQDFQFSVVAPPANCSHPLNWWRRKVNCCLGAPGPRCLVNCGLVTVDHPAAIHDHFYENAVRPIRIENVTHGEWGLVLSPDRMQATLNAPGNSPWVDKAQAEFLALLLNVVSSCRLTTDVVDANGGTLSQAMQQIADWINDGSPGNDLDAWWVAGRLNGSGQIPVSNVVDVVNYVTIPYAPRPTPAVGPLRVTPNPMVKSSTLEFVASSPGDAVVQVFDVAGRLVRTLVDQELPIGRHSAVWDGRSDGGQVVANGVYFYRISTPDGVMHARFVVMQSR
jgi:hypothetical protein